MNTANWRELIRIQEAEDRIFSLKKKYDQLQAARVSNLNLEVIERLENNRTVIKNNLYSLNKKLKKDESELEQLTGQQQEITKRLYGGSINNSKELTQLEQKLNELKNKGELLEDSILNLLQQKDDLLENKKKIVQQLELDQVRYKNSKQQLEQEESKLKELLRQHLVKRKSLLSKVSPELYNWYSKLKKEKSGQAVVMVKNEVCGGCHVGLSSYMVASVRSGKQLLTCENCGRILYWKD